MIIIVASLLGWRTHRLFNHVLATPASDLEPCKTKSTHSNNKSSGLQSQVNAADQNYTFTDVGNASLAQIYAQVKDSVVVVQGYMVQYDIFGRAYYSGVQGSGFIYDYNGQMIVVTNNHVVQDTINNTVTFANGDTYSASVLGSDPYADLAALSTDAPAVEYKPLEIASSSTLNVGDPLIAVGGPYGLAGSMTTGIVSALGRTITADSSSSYPIANVIQTSTPINPGNSGGPLLNYEGQVVGITTAIVSNSQRLRLRHPIQHDSARNRLPRHRRHVQPASMTLAHQGTDMTYEIAKALNVNVTYGWLITGVTSGGPADNAGIKGGTTQTSDCRHPDHRGRRHNHRVRRKQNKKHGRPLNIPRREYVAEPDNQRDDNPKRRNDERVADA